MKKLKIVVFALILSMVAGPVFAQADLVGTPQVKVKEAPISRPVDKDLLEVDARLPVLEGLTDKEAEKELNALFARKLSRTMADISEAAKVASAKADREGAVFRPFQLSVDFSIEESEQTLSILTRTYQLRGGANGTTELAGYTLDKRTGRLLDLEDLFVDDEAYIGQLNEAIRSIIADEPDAGRAFFQGDLGFKTLDPDQDFALGKRALYLYFEPYTLAPGSEGPVTLSLTLDGLDLKEEYLPRALEDQSYYRKVEGRIIEVEDRAQGGYALKVEDKKGQPASFMVSQETYIDDPQALAPGAYVFGYFAGNQPIIMIYPPQYPLDVLALDEEDVFYDVDRYDEGLTNQARDLTLNIREDTRVLDSDGKAYEGPIRGRHLFVTYRASTRSIPAITSPDKVVVLSKKAALAKLPEGVKAEDLSLGLEDKALSQARVIKKDAGLYLPLRPVAEALGYEVGYRAEDMRVVFDRGLGQILSLSLDEGSYQKGPGPEAKVSHTPLLEEGRSYVHQEDLGRLFLIERIYYSDQTLIIQP